VFDVIRSLTPSARGELEIADAINGLIECGLPVETSVTEEYWIDTGKMADILAANRAVLDAAAEPVTARRGVTFIPPVAVAADAVVEDSRIGPYASVGPRCVVRGSTVENTILMEHAVLEDCPGIRDSMIGRFAVARRAPQGAVLTLGDHSSFEGPA
jgi:glucose-1-phosphate thymidylyltransferase